MQVVITQISACYEIVDQNGDYIGEKKTTDKLQLSQCFQREQVGEFVSQRTIQPYPWKLAAYYDRRNAELMSMMSFHV